MRIVAFLLLCLAALLPLKAQTTTSSQSPKHEVRAVWLTTLKGLDWPRTCEPAVQKEELIHTIDQLHAAGINTVLFQARIRATTVYTSKIEPWDPVIAGGKHPGYDPLQLCIEECHKRGMECHAWVCTLPIGKINLLGYKEFKKKHHRLVKRIGDEAYMNPENPQTATYLANLCREIVSNYDVDGIHLDYIRYPETWTKVKKNSERNQRRANITRIVTAISQAVKQEKPWVKMSCSPVGKYDNLTRYPSGGWNARTAVCQDAQLWLKTGLMDQLYPMMYFQGNHFYPFAIDWQEQSGGHTVVPGLGIYFLDPNEGQWTLDIVEREMNVSRQIGMGHCFFRSRFLTNNVKGIYDLTCRFNQTPALVPPMTWMNAPEPPMPQEISINGNVLSWQAPQNNSDAPHLFYNIYASPYFPVDTEKAENIVATRLTATQLIVPTNGMNYAVTTMNRYGMESAPAQLQLNPNALPSPDSEATQVETKPLHRSDRQPECYSVITTDGLTLRVPARLSTLEADFLIVETIQGKRVAVVPFCEVLNIAALADGHYQLRSLGKKGRNHRLGFFIVKRQ